MEVVIMFMTYFWQYAFRVKQKNINVKIFNMIEMKQKH